jgi:hypothetical protein
LSLSEYHFVIKTEGKVLFSKLIDTNDKQMSNYAIRKLARAFMRAETLAKATLGFGIGDSDDEDYFERPALLVETDVFEVALQACDAWWNKEPEVEYLHVRLFFSHPESNHMGLVTGDAPLGQFEMRCTVPNAVKFGNELRLEALRVAALRAAAGCTAHDDIGEW